MSDSTLTTSFDNASLDADCGTTDDELPWLSVIRLIVDTIQIYDPLNYITALLETCSAGKTKVSFLIKSFYSRNMKEYLE